MNGSGLEEETAAGGNCRRGVQYFEDIEEDLAGDLAAVF